MTKSVNIRVTQLKDGTWRGAVRVNAGFYAGVDAPTYYQAISTLSHYAAGVTSEMESA